MNRGHFRRGQPGGPGRRPLWNWLRELNPGASFCLSRRADPAYCRHPENFRAVANRWGVRVSIRALAPGLVVTRVA